MSLVFNDSSTYKGIVQIYEKEIGANRGDISGDSNKLKELTADVNLAWDSYLSLAIPASGTWQYDDSNHTDYPIIRTNLVASQRDYTLGTDEGSNLVLDIFKVAILPSSSATDYVEIDPVDTQSEEGLATAFNSSTTGVPTRYDKTGNGILLDPKPSYNATNGLMAYINREPSYFISTDTTKKPGCPGNHHRYFALRPAQDYIRRHGTAEDYARISLEVAKMEEIIKNDFGLRPRDERRRITAAYQNNK